MARQGTLTATTCIAACGAAIATMVLGGAAVAGAQPSTPNLLKNGTAEAAAGGTGKVVNVPGWTRLTGTKFTAVKYGTPGFPSNTSAAPPNRGKNFFAGGPYENSFPNQVATQTFSLMPYVAQIKTGTATATGAGWFGGKGSQGDTAGMEINFKDANNNLISSFSLGFPSRTARHNVTGLLHDLKTYKIPKLARSVFVELIFDRVSNADTYNDGYADNVTVTLNLGGGTDGAR